MHSRIFYLMGPGHGAFLPFSRFQRRILRADARRCAARDALSHEIPSVIRGLRPVRRVWRGRHVGLPAPFVREVPSG